MKASSLLRSSTRANTTVSLASIRRRPLSALSAASLHPGVLSAVGSPFYLSEVKLPRAQHATSFSTSCRSLKGLQPGSSEPETPNTEAHSGSGDAAQLSEAEYHEIADQYLDSLVLALEEMSETTANSSEALEVEFSAGVLTVTHPKIGTYVINKQPPNSQIWLSSPMSGPKRFDWVVSGAGQHEKEGSAIDAGDDGAGGRWVYLRDGTSLSDLLKKELGVEITKHDESDVVSGREGPAGGGASS